MTKVNQAILSLTDELTDLVGAGGRADHVADAILRLIDVRLREVIESIEAQRASERQGTSP